MHAQGHRQRPGQGMEVALAAPGQQFQQLPQFLAPRAHGPEQLQRLGQGPPVRAGAQQLGEEHGSFPPLALPHGLGIGRHGCGQGGGDGRTRAATPRVDHHGR